MNDAEKALAGLEFIKGHPYLANKRLQSETLCFELNNLPPTKQAEKQEILNKLIPNHQGDFYIKTPVIIEYGEFIHLGKNFFANYDCKFIDGGHITFGDNVLIGTGCTFLTPNHALDPARRLEGYMIFKPINVGNNVWFGSNVTVCPGVNIGDNSVIAAGSVVTKDLPANVLAAGNPCKVIKQL